MPREKERKRSQTHGDPERTGQDQVKTTAGSGEDPDKGWGSQRVLSHPWRSSFGSL
jgi:hypothetical protein